MNIKKSNIKPIPKGNKISSQSLKSNSDDINFWLWLPVLILTYLFIAYQKRPMAFMNPQFIAEDGCVFYQDAINEGFKSIFMINSTYHDFLIRVAAYFTYVTTDILYAPAMFNFLTLVIYVVCAIYIYKRVDENKVTKLAFATIFLLAPYGAEGYLWLTMIHFLTPVLLILPFLYPRNTKRSLIIDSIMIVVLGMTGPNAALYLPVVLIIFLYKKQWRNKSQILLYSFFVVVGLFQFYNINSVDIDQRTNGQGEVVMDNVYKFGAHFMYDTFISVISGPVYFYNFNPEAHKSLLILILIFILFAIYKTIKGNDAYFKILVFLFLSIIISVSTIMAWKKLPFAIVPPANPATRYIATQTCFILFAIILLIQPKNKKWIYGLITFFIWSSFPIHNLLKQKGWLNDTDGHWAEAVRQYKAGEICDIPTLYVNEHYIKIKNCQAGAAKKIE